MAELQIHWLPEAKELLAKRDRFTRRAIQDDFAANLEKDKVALDENEQWYATPVADNRYTVIWHATPDGVVLVKAVVASQFRGESAAQLKNKLEQMVAFETNGLMTSLF